MQSLAPIVVEPLLRGRFGRPYLYLERCETTQRLLDAGFPEGAVAVCEEQTSGRGRLGRTWEAPLGSSILVSILLRPPAASRPAELTLVAALAAALAIERAAGRSAEVKWPNDVLLDGGKVSGILAEVVPGHPEAVVIGAGVNTLMTRADLPVETATSFAATGLEVDEDRLLADYLVTLDAHLTALSTAHGDAAAAGILGEIEALCTTIGSEVVVSLPDGTKLRGHAQRIDPEGRLVVIDGDVETPVSAGDVVHVR